MWERETEFEELLEKGIKKTTKSSIDEVVALAIDEEKWGYKHVVGLLKKAMAKGKKDRIKVLYIISSICRKSRSQLGAKDKYAQRFTPVLPSIAKLLAEAPAEDLVQADKVLQTWRRDLVFDSYALSEFEEILKKGRAPTASKQEKRKAAKQEASQGPPGADGDVHTDFGITFEDDIAPPLPIAQLPSRIATSCLEPSPAFLEQPTKKARGSRWGVPNPPPAQPQLCTPTPPPQLNSIISRATPVQPEPSHPSWEPLEGSAESASQQQASVAFIRPSSGGPPAQPPVSSSQPLERVKQEDAMKRVRELAAEFMARASKSAALEQQSDMEEPGAAALPPPPPPPPLRPPQWPAPSAVSAPQASQRITSALQPSRMPAAPLAPPCSRPFAPIPGPRPPPGSPPRQSKVPSQQTLLHPLPPQQPPTLPACWPAAPPAAPRPAAPYFHSSWSGAPSMDQHLSSGLTPPPPPPPPPPAPVPPPNVSTPPLVPPALPNGAGASEPAGSNMQEHVVPAAPPSPPRHAPASAQEPAWMLTHAAPQAALEPEAEATPAKNRGLQPSPVADQPANTIPGLDSNTGRDDNASEEDWWTTVTSSLPNLDGLMSPS